MAITDCTSDMKAVVSLPVSNEPRANPFANAKDVAAAAAADQSHFAVTQAQETALAIRTPRSDQQKAVRKVSFSKKLFSCACVRPAVSGDAKDSEFDVANRDSLATSSNSSSMSDAQRKKGVYWDISPKKSGLNKQGSVAYTDVDW